MDWLTLSFLGALFTLLIIKLWVKYGSGECKSTLKLINKTVVITGADKGIGYETSLDLAGRGAKVVMACRDVKNAEKIAAKIVKETGNEKVVVMKIDLSSLQSVREFAKAYLEKEERLDVLINNAGIPSTGDSTEEGFTRVFVVNYLGHFLLTHLLKDLLKQSAPSRVINVSSHSSLHTFSVDPSNLNNHSYSHTKTLQILHALELNRQLQQHGVIACSLHPGLIWNPNFFQKGGLYLFLVSRLMYPFMKTSRQGAQTTIHVAVDATVQGGGFYSDCRLSLFKPLCINPALAKKVYEASETCCGIN